VSVHRFPLGDGAAVAGVDEGASSGLANETGWPMSCFVRGADILKSRNSV